MKLTGIKGIGLVAAAVFPLYSGFSQDTPATPPATPPPVPTQPAAPPPEPAAPAPVSAAPTIVVNPSRETQEVVKLSKAGVSEDVILAYIKGSRTFFSLSANDILHLKDQGITTPVVTAMLTHDHELRTQGIIPPNSTVTFTAGSQFPPPGQTVAEPPMINQGTTNAIQTPPLVPGGASPNGDQPPPPQSEVVPVAPGPDYYWAPGYWGWNGGWVWVGGVWYPRAWGWGWRSGWGWHGGWGWGGWHGGGGWHTGGGGHSGGGSHGGGGFGRGH